MCIPIKLPLHHYVILHQNFRGLKALDLPCSFLNLAWLGVHRAWPVSGLKQPSPHSHGVALKYSRSAIKCAQASGLIAVSA